MCGRFLLAVDPAELQEEFPDFSFPSSFEPRYNVAPSQPVLVIPNDDSKKAVFFVWGLIPAWTKDPSIGTRLINARAETLSEKSSFRGPFKHHRCLILANGFYEWRQNPGGKTKIPFHIRLKNNKPFAFAGLWDEWHSFDGSLVKSCTIITTNPNEIVASIHNRMPVILPAKTRSIWLDPEQSTIDLQNLLVPYPSSEMNASPVSSYVNNPANRGSNCIAEINN